MKSYYWTIGQPNGETPSWVFAEVSTIIPHEPSFLTVLKSKISLPLFDFLPPSFLDNKAMAQSPVMKCLGWLLVDAGRIS